MSWAYFVLGMVFIVVVIPTWLRLHYRRRDAAPAGLSADERRELEALRDRARRLEERLTALERISPPESPR